jgi:hypothetical protein
MQIPVPPTSGRIAPPFVAQTEFATPKLASLFEVTTKPHKK